MSWKEKLRLNHVLVWDAGDKFVVTTTYFQGHIGKQTLALAGRREEKAESESYAQAKSMAEDVDRAITDNQPMTKREKGKR